MSRSADRTGSDLTGAEKQEHILQSQLEEYCASGIYPMHMPGHKRNLSPAPGLPYAWDLTEVEGTDDLHHAEGILREAMERASSLWGSRRTWFLVGGSTCGILASVYAAVPSGGEIIAARNCHKSVFHAIELQNLRPHWIIPRKIGDWGISGSVGPDEVERLLNRFPASRAVIVTSPTYEGVVSDIRRIAGVCHRAGVPLIVDEAHGAHFGLFRHECTAAGEEEEPTGSSCSFFPDSALHLGADLVIQSAHKTLPSLTQTALLHMGKESGIPEGAVEHGLDLYETSSPSYPLMASLDGCTGILRGRGPSLFRQWQEGIRQVEQVIPSLRELEVFRPAVPTVCDRSRFLIRAKEKETASGAKLAALLREHCGVEPEMHCGRNVLLMTGCGDTPEGFRRLSDALVKLDAELNAELNAELSTARDRGQNTGAAPCDFSERSTDSAPSDQGQQRTFQEALPIGEAVRAVLDGQGRLVPLSEAEGRIAGEYVMAYPPGVPILAPGERITPEAVRAIRSLAEQGSNMIFSSSTGIKKPEDLRQETAANDPFIAVL